MAALKQKIQQDLTTALKEKKELELSVLRMLNAAIINKEKEKRYKISSQRDKSLTELPKEAKVKKRVKLSSPFHPSLRSGKVKTELGEEDKSSSSATGTRLRDESGKESESLFDFADARVTEEELEKESGLLEDEVLEIISSEIKKRKEAALLFEKGKRMDLSEKERAEAKILEKYLPEQLSEEEIKKLAREIIEKNGAKNLKDMGKVMAELMPKLKGKADGGLVSKIIRELLAQ